MLPQHSLHPDMCRWKASFVAETTRSPCLHGPCPSTLRIQSSFSTFQCSVSTCFCSSHHFTFLHPVSFQPHFLSVVQKASMWPMMCSHDRFFPFLYFYDKILLCSLQSLVFSKWPMMVSHLRQSTCLSLPSSRITGVCHHALLLPELLGDNH